jgi:hypothetical protein
MSEIIEEEVTEAEDFGDVKENWFKRNTPIFMISLAFHMLILLLISLIPADVIIDDEVTVIITDIQAIEDIEDVEDIPVEDVKVEDIKIEIEDATTEDESEDAPEIDETLETPDDSEDTDMMPEAPLEDSGAMAVMGLMGIGSSGDGGGSNGPGNGLGNRTGKGKDKAIRKYKVDKKILNAVDKALKWLAEHQSKDGSWDVEKYEGGSNGRGQEAVSACALLPFLGAGHSERIGEYKDTMKRGIRYLNRRVSEKKNNPHFGNNYGSALILMALSEACIFGSSSTTEMNANAIATMFLDQYAGQGWHYNKGGQDFSVSGWVALGLKSAKAAELPVMNTEKAKKFWEQYREWVFTQATKDSDGMGYYSPNRKSTHMTWVGMFSRKMLECDSQDIFIEKATEHSMKWVTDKKWIGTENMGDVYGVYYGTLASFQVQGKLWKVWDVSMRKTLIPTQRQGSPKELGGSWNPTKGHTAKEGGRVLTTALLALCLEVYYRYEIMN